VELRADVRTEFARIFAFQHFGIEKLKHTVEPQLGYLFVPDIGQDDVPVFDGLDRVNQRNLLSYGIASRLLARSARVGNGAAAPPVYELARFSVIQSYDFERAIVPFAESDDSSHLSDIDLALRVNPSRLTSIRAGANYDPVRGQIPAASVSLQLFEPRRLRDAGPERQTIRNGVTLSYRFISHDVLQLLQASTVLRLTDRIGGIYATRYDIQRSRFLENFVGMRYISACDCWSIDVGVSDTSNPNEVQLRAQISLLGLGSVGSLGKDKVEDSPPKPPGS
jgi:LPS-assembly protein